MMTADFYRGLCNRLRRILLANLGLIVVALGVCFQMQADLGIAPWNALNQGISLQFSITYGAAYNIVSCLVLLAVVLFRESIGLGMILDAFVVGWATDAVFALGLVPAPAAFPVQLLFLLVGMVIVCVGQLIYMKAALGCGPRDAMLIALGKRFPRVTIGSINLIIFAIVLILAVLMGAPVGIGTVITVAFTGVLMDIVFKIARFDPCLIHHENLAQTCRALLPGLKS